VLTARAMRSKTGSGDSSDAMVQIRSKYLLGADGANSSVRAALGIGQFGRSSSPMVRPPGRVFNPHCDGPCTKSGSVDEHLAAVYAGAVSDAIAPARGFAEARRTTAPSCGVARATRGPMPTVAVNVATPSESSSMTWPAAGRS
jgi:hypothetical protein